MLGYILAPLRNRLSQHLDLSKTRLETLVIIMFGLINGRTVNLTHLATYFPRDALYASNYRRLQKFFKKVKLNEYTIANLVFSLLKVNGPRPFALDRTNWKLGKSDINILVLSIITRRFKLPIMFSFLNHRGNTSTSKRIGLMERYFREFDTSTIEVLLADREFVGDKWIEYLIESKIKFVIRLRKDMYIETEDEQRFQFDSFFKKNRKGQWKGWFPGMAHTDDNLLRFEGRKNKKNELIILVSNVPAPTNMFCLYRKRWGIECLFSNMKSRGFNFEDTHMTDPGKLGILLSIVTLTMCWTHCCGSMEKGHEGIKRKTHGRPEKSWFRIGLDTARKWIMDHPQNALKAWMRRCPQKPLASFSSDGIMPWVVY